MCIVVMGVIVVLLTVRVKQNIVTRVLICCFLKKIRHAKCLARLDLHQLF